MTSHLIKADEAAVVDRGGYKYRRLVAQGEQPYNCLVIEVFGAHSPRRVVHGIRNYYVMSGAGQFTVEDEIFVVDVGSLVVIHPGEVYSYNGQMELLEFNIPTDGKIAHEDVA